MNKIYMLCCDDGYDRGLQVYGLYSTYELAHNALLIKVGDRTHPDEEIREYEMDHPFRLWADYNGMPLNLPDKHKGIPGQLLR